MMKNFFVTGTDTNVGKTMCSAILTFALKGFYWKPIESGVANESSDRDTVQELTCFPDNHFFPSEYSLRASLSPDQAAGLENISIDLNRCHIPKITHPLIVEGAGGVFVPVNEDETMIDLMKKLDLPIVIVSRGTLGTINHTLLTIEVLRMHGLTIQGIVFNGELNPKNQLSIEAWGNTRTLFSIPFFNEVTPKELQNWAIAHHSIIMENLA